MYLYLSSDSALNSVYSTGRGHPVYKVETPSVSISETRRTIIRRAIETVDGVWLGGGGKDSYEDLDDAFAPYIQNSSPTPSSTTSSPKSGGQSFEGHFAHLAHIEYAALKPSRILYGGQEVRTNRLFKAKGWSWWGFSRNKVFRASDGCEYRWVIGSRNPKLVTNDSSKTVIARFHRRGTGPSENQGPLSPYLEIHSDGQHILDDILITFVYLRDAEEAKS